MAGRHGRSLAERYPASARLGAKLVAALTRFVVIAVAMLIVVIGVAMGLMAVLPRLPVAVSAKTWSVIPALHFLSTPGALLAFAMRYGLPDLGQLLLWGPPLATFALGVAAPRVSVRRRRKRAGIYVGLLWMLVWWCLIMLVQFLPPIMRAVPQGGGTVALHFKPAGQLDFYLRGRARIPPQRLATASGLGACGGRLRRGCLVAAQPHLRVVALIADAAVRGRAVRPTQDGTGEAWQLQLALAANAEAPAKPVQPAHNAHTVS